MSQSAMGATPPLIPPQFSPTSSTLRPPDVAPRSRSGGGVTLGLTIAMWIVWLGVSLVADFLAFLMFAFADSPGSAGAAQAMIVPTFAWFGFTFVAGAVLLFQRRWWGIALAFVLAVSPPFAVFAGYNLLDGAGVGGGRGGGVPSGRAAPPSTTPATRVHVPPGKFAPPPMKVREQPDFRKAIAQYRDAAAAATRPVTATTRP